MSRNPCKAGATHANVCLARVNTRKIIGKRKKDYKQKLVAYEVAHFPEDAVCLRLKWNYSHTDYVSTAALELPDKTHIILSSH